MSSTADLPPAIVASIRWLEGRVASLKAKASRNWTNSSKPPSTGPRSV